MSTSVTQANLEARESVRRRLVALVILALPLALCACGKKGPLRLPEPAPATAPAAASPAAPPTAPEAEDEAK